MSDLPQFVPEDAANPLGDIPQSQDKIHPPSLEDIISQKESPRAIFNYGIDHLDSANPTVKDQIYLALSAVERDGDQAHLDSLFSEKADHITRVTKEDLVATHDALVLRTRRLKHLGKNGVDTQLMERHQNVLADYLNPKQSDDASKKNAVDLSDSGIAIRVQRFEGLVNNLSAGLPEFDIQNVGYKSLVKEAAKIYAYHSEPYEPLLIITDKIAQYHPRNLDEFQRRLASVASLDIESDPFIGIPESVAGGISRKDIVEELNSFIEQMKSDGFEPTVTMFFGSANEGRARSKEVDSEDPSAIDLFMIVPDDSLEKIIRGNRVRLNKSKKFYGKGDKKIVSYTYIVPSSTNKLLRTECFVYSESQFRQMLDDKDEFSKSHPDRLPFLENVLKGRVVQGSIPPWVGSHLLHK